MREMNGGDLPFIVTQNSREALKAPTIACLMGEIRKGTDSVHSENDWVSEEEMLAHFGIGVEAE